MDLRNLVLVGTMSEIPATKGHCQFIGLMLPAANDNSLACELDKSYPENCQAHISGDHFLFSADLLVRTEALSDSSQSSTITSPGFLKNYR